MRPNTIVAIVLIVVILIVGLYDCIALMFYSPQYSVSIVVKSWSRLFPILPLVLGIVLGHIFWPVERDNIVNDNEKARIASTQ